MSQEITITVGTPGGDHLTIDVESDLRTGDLIEELIQARNLPRNNARGEPIVYVLDNKKRGKEKLDRARTLQENGIQDGDDLRLWNEPIAGGGRER